MGESPETKVSEPNVNGSLTIAYSSRQKSIRFVWIAKTGPSCPGPRSKVGLGENDCVDGLKTDTSRVGIDDNQERPHGRVSGTACPQRWVLTRRLLAAAPGADSEPEPASEPVSEEAKKKEGTGASKKKGKRKKPEKTGGTPQGGAPRGDAGPRHRRGPPESPAHRWEHGARSVLDRRVRRSSASLPQSRSKLRVRDAEKIELVDIRQAKAAKRERGRDAARAGPRGGPARQSRPGRQGA